MSVSGHIKAMTIGGSKVTKAYFNGQLVFEESATVVTDENSPYVKFTTEGVAFTMAKANTWDGDGLEYSTDAKTWKTYTAGENTDAAYDSDTGQYAIYFRGSRNTALCKSGTTAPFLFGCTTVTGYNVSGNLYALLDYKTVAGGKIPDMVDYCFYHLFYNQSTLLKVDCWLNATTIPAHAYDGMFMKCSKLYRPPVLKGTTVGEYGMYQMFEECKYLENMAQTTFDYTTVASHGMEEMFMDSGLTQAIPFANAVSLSESACYCMYKNCSSLQYGAEELKLTQVGDSCCAYMYSMCDQLQTAMDIVIEADTCGSYAFSNCYESCSAMTDAGSIDMNYTDVSGANGVFTCMYSDCTALEKLPGFFSISIANDICTYMFTGCKSLKEVYSFMSIGRNITTVNGDINYYFYGMFVNTGIAFSDTYSSTTPNAYSLLMQNSGFSVDSSDGHVSVYFTESRMLEPLTVYYTSTDIKYAG